MARQRGSDGTKSLSDLLLVLFIVICVALFSSFVDLYSYIHKVFINLEIDNFLLANLALAICLFWFSYRRWNDTRRELASRKIAETALKETEIRYKSLFHNSLDILLECDFNGRIIDANESACKLLGRSLDSLLECRPENLFHKQDLAEFLKELEYIKTNGKDSGIHVYRMKTAAGETVWVEAAGVRVDRAAKPISALITTRDITKRLKMEEDKRELEKQLLQVQKMETLGDLAGGIAHDFNNILTPIIGYAEMLLEDLPADGMERKDVKRILISANRAKDLVIQILTFSRQVEPEKTPVLLHLVADEVLKLLESTLPKSIELRRDFRFKNDYVHADATQMHQVILNLCTNAYHAMEPDGGILELALDSVELGSEASRVNPQLKPGHYVCLRISDTGHGMEQGVMDRIFEPFFTTKKKGKGTGIGLAVVHGIIMNHGGAITVDSRVGEGTVFKVYLPLFNKPAKQDSAVKLPLRKGSERILLVDDEEAITTMADRMLKRLGYTIRSSNEPLDALEIFRASPGEFDLVITDYTMPGINGRQLAERLHRIRENLPIVLATGSGTGLEGKNNLNGFKALLEKPLTSDSLSAILRKVFDD